MREERDMATHETVDSSLPHTEEEQLKWEINIPGHAPRSDSPEYKKSRKRMHDMLATVADPFLGPEPVEDHHGGGLWLKDADGWFMVRNLAGIEWSAQFCADPAKVDLLRQNARRVYAAYPQAVEELGIRELLDTPITDADGVAEWTDSICNASVPLPHHAHSATLPKGGGVHHYPTPITDIDLIRYADFKLWVTDENGENVAVAPVDRRGSGDARIHVLYAAQDSTLRAPLLEAQSEGRPLLLAPDHPVARAAFINQ